MSLFGLPDLLAVSKAATVVLGEMFVPNILAAGLLMAARYVVAVTSVAAIIYITGSIPCMLASDVKFRLRDPFFIWYERTFLSILISGIIGLIVF